MEYYGNNDWRDYVRTRNELEHFGTPKHSGRYPWGSGDNPYHHGADSPRKRYKARKAEIKKEVKARRREMDKEELDFINKEMFELEPASKGIKKTKEFYKDLDGRRADLKAKYKSDLKTAKEQYRIEKRQAGEEKPNDFKRSVGNAARTYLQKTAEANKAMQDEKVNKNRAYYDAVLNEKSLGRALKTSMFGSDKLRATNARIEADTHDRLAKSAATKIVANEQSVRAANKRHMADYYDKRSSMSKAQRVEEAIFKTEYYKTPYTRINGKTTTIGAEKVRELGNELLWNTSMYLITGEVPNKNRKRTTVNGFLY